MIGPFERQRSSREEFDAEGGFTLIEILIVIVILAILAAIVVIAVQGMEGSTAKASCEYDVQTVDHAIQAYDLQMGSQPTVIQNTANGSATGQLMPTSQLLGANGSLVGPWLHSVPTNGKFYTITIASVGSPAVSYVEVTAPTGGPSATTSVIYEPNGTASGTPGLSTNTVVPIATTIDRACSLVTD